MRKSTENNEINDIYSNILNEDMTSGEVYGGDIGGHAGIENTDWYAPGDARNPYGLGITTRKGKAKSKKKEKKEPKKKKKSKKNRFTAIFDEDEEESNVKKGFAEYFKSVNKDSKFDSDELEKGINVEMEHTTDSDVAEVIAKQHLEEDPKYYSKLEKVHNEQ